LEGAGLKATHSQFYSSLFKSVERETKQASGSMPKLHYNYIYKYRNLEGRPTVWLDMARLGLQHRTNMTARVRCAIWI
jgi:hypothetical protein